MTTEEAVKDAIMRELRQFLLPDKLPEQVEIRVLYDNTLATLRVPLGDILKQEQRGEQP